MSRREQLMATLHGERIDRPPVCFYELNRLNTRMPSAHPLGRMLPKLTLRNYEAMVEQVERFSA